MSLANAIRKFGTLARRLPDIASEAHLETYQHLAVNLVSVARSALQSALGSEAHPDDIDRWLATFVADNDGRVMRFTLSSIESNGRPGGTHVVTGPITLDDVEAWVRAGAEQRPEDLRGGKIFDGRDLGVDATVKKMQGILLKGRDDGDRARARDKYLPFIDDFRNNAEGSAINDKLASEGPELVLNAWKAYLSHSALFAGAVSRKIGAVLA